VTPLRTPTNRRLYTDEDIERLNALRLLTQAGRSIGQIARLPMAQLRTLIQVDHELPEARDSARATVASPESFSFYIQSCLDAVERLDADALERALTQTMVAFGQPVVIESVIAPLMQQIGELWHAGAHRMTHEHLASAVVRHVLWDMSESYERLPHAPQLVVTTPVGQLHEIGALMASSTARRGGWNVLYLGPNLPAEEIASTVHPGVKAVALSISYPLDDPHLPLELKKLRQCLPTGIRILVGGRAAPAYAEVLASINAISATTLTEFSIQLEALRSSGSEPRGAGPLRSTTAWPR
jgi:methanogenic corrinoid protein MtbC1